jgi:DNA-binding beta-propeller fold protein YncE
VTFPAKKQTAPLAALGLCLALALPACKPERLCASDETLCGHTCSTLATDPASCGACGHACGEGQVCTAGQCVFGTAQNCGALGRTCGSGERCASGDCVADLYLACFDTDEVREATSGLAAAGVPVATAAGPIALAWLGDTLYVADSISNAVDALRFDPPAVRKAGTITIPAAPVGFSDLEFMTAANGLLYASNAAANVLDVLDPVGMKVLDEIPLGPGFNPQGILVPSAAKAYVALNGSNEIAVLDVSASATCGSPPCGKIAKRIAIPAELASPTGSPLPARLALVDGKLYVTLWNLKGDFTPAGSGRLAVVDTATDTLVTDVGSHPVDLGAACQNPGDIAVQAKVLYVTCGFAPFNAPASITGAAIVPVDVSSGSPAVRTALSLSTNNAGPIAFCGGAGYVGDRASGSVLKYDPGSNSILSTQPLCPAPGNGGTPFVAAVACGP